MSVAFVRQLGYESGIQLNPLQDKSDGYAPDNSDQVFAIPMRTIRGRINKPFKVSRSDFLRKLGKPESIRQTRLNEAMAQVYAALKNGAYEAVVYRLHTDAAKLQWIIVSETVDRTGFTFALADEVPEEDPFILAIKHMDCFSDGLKIQLHANTLKEEGVVVDNKELTLRLLDPQTDEVLYAFTGSLDMSAQDDFGRSYYLPDIITEQADDELDVMVGVGASISKTSTAYGNTTNGSEKNATSGVMLYFTEGGTNYAQSDYTKARDALRYTEYDWFYIASGGNQNVALLQELMGLAYDTNRQLRFDIDGALTPAASIAFVEQFNIDSQLVHAFWSPLKSADPVGISPKYHIGTSALNIALACARNAVVNARGFAKKNQAIAGKPFPVPLSNIVQTYFPTDNEFSALAQAKINPVVYEQYNGGGQFVWKDSLTMAKTLLSYRKLISVAEMHTSIDEMVTRFGKECLQRPMKEATRMMKNFLQVLFEGAESAEWITPSQELDGRSFQYVVQPNAARPADLMDVAYSLHYDGTTRQMHVTQTLVKP